MKYATMASNSNKGLKASDIWGIQEYEELQKNLHIKWKLIFGHKRKLW
jgi:hypothetical protein